MVQYERFQYLRHVTREQASGHHQHSQSRVVDECSGQIVYRLLYGRGVPLGHIGTGVAISARGPIWPSSANMT